MRDGYPSGSRPASAFPAPTTGLRRPERFEARIVKSRFGYYAHCTYGVASLGEPGGLPFSFTLRGIRRKVERLKRKVERDQAWEDNPVEVIR